MAMVFADLSGVVAYWRSGGPLMVPLLFCCFLIWGYFLRSRRVIRQVIADVRAVHDGRSADGPVGLLVTRSRRAGDGAAWEFEGEAAGLLDACRRDIVVLAAVTVSAPLLGLLGTVAGMSETFSGVAAMSSATTSRVAGGISTALVTTQFGLVVSIPGLFGVAMLQRLTAGLRAALGGCRRMLLRECSHVVAGGAA